MKGFSRVILVTLVICSVLFSSGCSKSYTLSDVEKHRQDKNVTALCEIIDDTKGNKEFKDVLASGIEALISLKDEKGDEFLHKLVINKKVDKDTRVIIIEKASEANENFIKEVMKKYQEDAKQYLKFNNDVVDLLDEMRFYGDSNQTDEDVWISRMKIACSFVNNTEDDKLILDYLEDRMMLFGLYDNKIVTYLKDYKALIGVNPFKEADGIEKSIEQKGNERLALGKTFGNPRLQEERRLYLIDIYNKYGTDKYLKEINRMVKQDQEDVQKYFRLEGEIKELQNKLDDIYSGKRAAELKNQERILCAKIKSWKTHNEGTNVVGAMGININTGAFLGIHWDKLIDEQPINFKYKMAAGWAWIFECTEIEKLKLDDVIPVDKIKIKSLQFNTKNKVLKEIDMFVEDSSQVVKQYLTDKYGSTIKGRYYERWEVGEVAIIYLQDNDETGRVIIRTKEYQDYLENSNA